MQPYVLVAHLSANLIAGTAVRRRRGGLAGPI